MFLLKIIIFSSVLLYVNGRCGYENCPKGDANKLNVHLVPHTHNDVGWLKTVDQYYYGANVTIQQGAVQYILDTVIDELLKDPTKKFIYVEIAFFTRWWFEQTDKMKEDVKDLVRQGRLEFILAGWCMNDEASTHYSAIIDQMTIGLEFINETFGECGRPKVAWQIDPFGHSREQASLFAHMGFDGLFFGRLDYQDKEKREKEKNMEFIWRGSESLPPPTSDLFTGVNQNGYNPPDGFCFDQYCADQPIMDDPLLEDYNLEEKIKLFIQRAREQAKHYATNHIMWTMGSDFQYSNAKMWFKNMDKLIRHVEAADINITTFYSTPSCYLKSLHESAKQWNVKTDDFFPYAERPHSFWTGYFTSRPALKRYTRDSNRLLQACTQLESSMTSSQRSVTSWRLKKAMGVAQHHDAVSGTSKQHVANDYAKRLYEGREECKKVISEVLVSGGQVDNLIFCDFLNISFCRFTETNSNFTLIAYNPLARHVTSYIRVPVSSDHLYHVTNELGQPQNISFIHSQNSSVMILQVQMEALSTSSYKITSSLRKIKDTSKVKDDRPYSIMNEFYQVKFDEETGLMSEVQNIKSGLHIQMKQNLLWYNSSKGDDLSDQQSGAYVFRPNSSIPFPCTNGKVKIEKHVTSLVQEIHQTFNEWCHQVVRLYRNQSNIEVEWKVGPIPINDGYGKEVISRYETNIENFATFFTDSNGREMIERRKNFRPTWKLNQSEEVAGNYFPINSRAFIKDSKTQLTILTDRSQGGASLANGFLEIMVP